MFIRVLSKTNPRIFHSLFSLVCDKPPFPTITYNMEVRRYLKMFMKFLLRCVPKHVTKRRIWQDLLKVQRAKRAFSSRTDKHHLALIEQIYSQEETKKILHYVNSESEVDLESHRFGTERIRQLIVQHRPFNSLQDIIKLPRVDIIQLERLCSVALADKTTLRTGAAKKVSLCYPDLDPEKAQSVKTITAIRLDRLHASWLSMSDQLAFIQAGKYEMTHNDASIHLLRYDHVLYNQVIQSFINQLPATDVYLLFRQPFRLSGKSVMAVAVQGGRSLLDATFAATLANQPNAGSVHVMSYLQVASLFGANIGGEAVNIQNIASKIIEESVWNGHTLSGLNVLKMQLEQAEEQAYDPYSLLLLQCTSFISQVLYPARANQLTAKES